MLQHSDLRRGITERMAAKKKAAGKKTVEPKATTSKTNPSSDVDASQRIGRAKKMSINALGGLLSFVNVRSTCSNRLGSSGATDGFDRCVLHHIS
jgi:hypothetical protein